MPPKIHNFQNNYNLLRHLAASQVLLVHSFHHFGYESAFVDFLELFPGVPVFFFISGHLIARSYLGLDGQVIKKFAWRRSLRIFPGLWIVVFAGALLPAMAGYTDYSTVSKGHFIAWIISQATIFQFYNPEFLRGFGVGSVNGALWTISVELTFYIVTPLLIWMVRRSLPLVVLIALSSIAANLYAHHALDVSGFFSKMIRSSFVPWFYIYIFGALLACLPSTKKWFMTLPASGLIIGYLSSMYFVGNIEMNSSNGINPISAITLAVLTLRLGESRKIYRYIGRAAILKNDVSYGMYIWHMPIINALLYYDGWTMWPNIFGTLVFTIIIAVLSWRFVERPMLRMKAFVK